MCKENKVNKGSILLNFIGKIRMMNFWFIGYLYFDGILHHLHPLLHFTTKLSNYYNLMLNDVFCQMPITFPVQFNVYFQMVKLKYFVNLTFWLIFYHFLSNDILLIKFLLDLSMSELENFREKPFIWIIRLL